MGNTIRRNADITPAQDRRARIIAGRRAAQNDRAVLRAYDDRAIAARLNPGR